MSENRTEISSLGEFGLIDHLTANIEIKNASTLVGVGDDAAVIDHFGKQTVITTDLLLEEVHFDLMYTPLQHLGYKSVIVNLSDVYAMGGRPVLAIAILLGFTVLAGGIGRILPQSFLPDEDQGYFIMNVELPEASSLGSE